MCDDKYRHYRDACICLSCPLSLSEGSFEECRSIAEELINRKYLVRVGYVSDLTLELRVVSVVNWLYELAKMSDGMCRLICNALDEDLLVHLLPHIMALSRDMQDAVYDLLLTLMADQSFKIVIAVAYVRSYDAIARIFSTGLGSIKHSVYNLSVQYLNREMFVNEVCYEHSFLETTIKALLHVVVRARDHAVAGLDETSRHAYQLLPHRNMTIALHHDVFEHRRYNPILGDLKVSAATAVIGCFG